MTAGQPAIDREALLAPIPGERPTGVDLRYDADFDRIKAARRSADDKQQGRSPEGDTDTTLTPQQRAAAAREYWNEVERLVIEALTKRSKDLQLTVWLLEVEAYTGGFGGAADVLPVITGLLERYWDDLYPSIDDEDDEPLARRAGVLDWLNEKLPGIFKSTPLSSGTRKYSLGDLELAQRATTDAAKAEIAAAGRPSAEQFAQAMTASSSQHLESLSQQIDGCLAQLAQLEQMTDARFVTRTDGEARPGHLVAFTTARKTLEDCQFQVGRALRAKGPRETTQAAAAAGATAIVPSGDEIWDRALQLVMQGQLEGLRLAQDHIDAAMSGRERFLRQLHLSELCIQAGMHAFAYPILDELGKIIDARDLANWEDPELIRRTWSGLANVCKPLARLRPESVAREAEAQQRLSALGGESQPTAVEASAAETV